MTEVNELNSVFYALRILSHGLDLSKIEVVKGEAYPASEFTEEEQCRGLEILAQIQDREGVPLSELSTGRVDVCLSQLAGQVETLANGDLIGAGYDLGYPGPDLEATESLLVPPHLEPQLGIACIAGAKHIPILITGEYATGKETLVRMAHASSKQNRSFKVIHCSNEKDLFELPFYLTANSSVGTIFLDGIDLLSPGAQAQLLRFMSGEGAFEAVENAQPSAWITCSVSMGANERDKLEKLRPDLLYLVSAVTVTIPPLRERPEDIRVLTQHFLKMYAANAKLPIVEIAPDVMTKLVEYSWPGNVRELKEIIEVTAPVATRGLLTIQDLNVAMHGTNDQLHFKQFLTDGSWSVRRVITIPSSLMKFGGPHDEQPQKQVEKGKPDSTKPH